jgi:glycogen phosphorylase
MSGTVDQTATWWAQTHANDGDVRVAYFSMEFGVDTRLAIYSGGLGVLAGDHLKAAAELGVPLVAVGLFYRGGYFVQGVSDEGRQTERYQELDPEDLGLAREPVEVEVDLGGELVNAAVWRYDVGSVPLYLLDVPWVTDALYSGNREHRIRQELLLGVGGVRALLALGITPSVYHVNEGHSAFLAIERARVLVEAGASTDDALEEIRRTTVFTTHTPVPAGNEVFGDELVLRYVGDLARSAGISDDRLLDLGRGPDTDGFGLTPLALRLSAHRNGVSELHGGVAREMWHGLWPDQATPIDAITNGVHLGTWLAPELTDLLREAGVQPEAPPEWANWPAAHELDPEALWRVHDSSRRRLAHHASLDPNRLTIGFARRFATYKRAGLVYSNLERLLTLPVQIVVAGKAHPQDAPGKDVMQAIVELSRGAAAGRVVFLEDYDIDLARLIIPGCDIWLNTPRRPYEASGTSGMKAAVNGVLNLSVLDGWWAEAYDPAYGWAIEGGSDEDDAEQLYTLLEQQVVPRFESRDAWLEMMKSSIAELAPRFSMQRTVIEYADRYYVPAAHGS